MKKYSPMMQHYLSLKENYQDAIVLYRLGDFYEMFFEDAKIAANELDLVLTGRSAGVKDRVPMCGVPHHAVNGYIQRLIQRGYKVAIVEQLEEAAEAKGIVKRDVVRVVTPGTVMDELGDEKQSIYIASIYDFKYGLALAVCEMATGETYVKSLRRSQTELQQQLLKNAIREVVLPEEFDMKFIQAIRELGVIMISYCNATEIDPVYLPLCEQVKEPYYLNAYGLLLNYLNNTQKRMLDHLRTVDIDDDSRYLEMDYATRQNLEIIDNYRNNGKNETLWTFLDHCRTAMGSRLLKRWIEKPLVDLAEIRKRQDGVEFLTDNFLIRNDLKSELNNIYDIERLIARIAMGTANGIDCARLNKSLSVLPNIVRLIKDMDAYAEFQSVDLCVPLQKRLESALVESPPVSIKEGGIFVDGYNTRLDEYRQIQRQGKKWIVQLEAQERDKTGVKNLKVGYNRVFGYYFEVSKANMHLIKESDGYTKKQTLANAERFISQELKEKEDAILHSEERSLRLETELFEQLLDEIKRYLPKLQKIAKMVSVLDVLYALASISSLNSYTRPVFVDSDRLCIKKGRHPIMEKLMKDQQYIANDLVFDQQQQIIILTGPNMGGKSTYMRQNALIVIMAQMGCFVPAQKAELPLFDKIFTRIGASDDILSGQSTFMVEMNEANHALQNATQRSLILFDEIGRGTSTYDGMALAQSMIEYIAACIHAKTLFSTHYHELTELENSIDALSNYHVEVYEEDEHVTFLYHVKKGKVDKSYGINVARLAKLPEAIIDRANELVKDLENKKKVVQQSFSVVEMSKPEPEWKSVREKLEMVDVNALTPLEALQMIDDLQREMKGRGR